jgi:chemotaxis protein MotB
VPEDAGGRGNLEAPIIKKVKKEEHASHGGAWKVAYADMVTALMALFIVLWILSQSDQIKQSVAGYFRDPVGFREGGVPTIMEGGSNAGTDVLVEDPKSRAAIRAEDDPEATAWRSRAGRIREALEQVPAFAKYRGQLELAITGEGLRISLVESQSTPLFQVGSLEMNPEAEQLLQTIGVEIRDLSHRLVIEGHTDSRPFPPGSRMTNWELSTGRAQTARRVLERQGVDPSRTFAVRGYADRKLYNPLDPEDSRNRRVSITLLSAEALERRRHDDDVQAVLN